jgi:2'-5' RNA ligase
MELRSIVLIVPPPEVQLIALPVAKRYAPKMVQRFPIHLTVHGPFLPYEQLPNAITMLRNIYAEVPAFEVTLAGYGTFPKVIFMAPQQADELLPIFQRSFAAFPEAPPYGGAFGNNPHAHVSVGFFDSEEEQAAAELPDYEPITFRVDCFHVMYGSYDPAWTTPWITEAIIPLGSQ